MDNTLAPRLLSALLAVVLVGTAGPAEAWSLFGRHFGKSGPAPAELKGDKRTLLPLTRKTIEQRFGTDTDGNHALVALQNAARDRQWKPSATWMEKQGKKYGRLVIVSDLHPGTGLNPVTGHVSPAEDFMPDRQEVDFHKMMKAEWESAGKDGKKRTIVMNGDVFEFMQTTTPPVGLKFLRGQSDKYGPTNTPRNTVTKLDAIRQGHDELFKTYAEHLAQGHRIVLVPGNHDRQLLNLAVRARLRGILQRDLVSLLEADPTVEAGLDGQKRHLAVIRKARAIIKDQYEFHPIFVHGDVFVHHGNHNDPSNSFSTLLGSFYDKPNRDKAMEAAFGDYFVKAVFNTVEKQIPWGDNHGSKTLLAYKALVKDGNGRLMSLGKILKAVGWVMTREGHGTAAEEAALKDRNRAEVERFVRDFGMTEKFNEVRRGDKPLTDKDVAALLLEYQGKHATPVLSLFKKNTGVLSRIFQAIGKLKTISRELKKKRVGEREDAANELLFSHGIKTYAIGHDHKYRVNRYIFGKPGEERLGQLLDSCTWNDTFSKDQRDAMAAPAEQRGVISVDITEKGSESYLMRWDPARSQLVRTSVLEDIHEATDRK